MADPEASQAAYLAEATSARLYASGFALVPPSREPGLMMHAPFALLPQPFPRSAFTAAQALAKGFNELVDAIARDPAWLRETLSATAGGDPFTARLLALFDACSDPVTGGPPQPLTLGVHRSDYMVDRGQDGASPPRLAQIELNTISSSFAGLSQQIAAAHRYVLQRYGGSIPLANEHASLAAGGGDAQPLPPLQELLASALPANSCLSDIAAGLAAGHREYVRRHANCQNAASSIVVAFVVQPNERNIMDQRLLEQELFASHGVPVRRVTLAQLASSARLREGDGALLIPSEAEYIRLSASANAASVDASEASVTAAAWWEEVSLVYYRSGYTPADYPSEVEWAGRELAERSLAVKCPSLGYHLAGAKKVQQALAAPGAVERFIPDAATAKLLRSCFAGLWSLDPVDQEKDASTASAIADAIAHPERYVMKPQREGGGNNVYGPAIARALAPPESGGLSHSERAAYILMERVFPRPAPTWFVRSGAVARLPAVSELGVYSVYLSDGADSPLLNVPAGHLLRTKVEGTDEGGVAAGFAVLDSPLLV